MPDKNTKELRIDELETEAQKKLDEEQDAKIAATENRIDAYVSVFQDKAWLVLKSVGVLVLIVISTVATATWWLSEEVAVNNLNTMRIDALEKLHPKRVVIPKPVKKGFFRQLIEGD